MAVPAGKIPHVTGIKIIDFSMAMRVDYRGAHAAFDDVSPFGGSGVPVQFSHRTWLKPHRDSGDALGNRQLFDRGFLAETIADDLSFRLLQCKFEARQLGRREVWVGDVVHKARIAGARRLGRSERRRGQANAADQNVSSLHINHGIALGR
jgi:hypothetical protein